MKINLNIEAIVREEVRNFIRETLVINNVSGDKVEVTINTKRMTHKGNASKWEYARKNGRRRTTQEIALHALEKKHGRLLTPEEKGEAKALVEIDATAENKAKEDTIKKAHIDSITAEGMAAASKELAEEEKEQDHLNYALPVPSLEKELPVPEALDKEATIPKAEELQTDSLFGN